MKTLFDANFGCPRTIAEVPIVDSGAFYEVDIFLHASFGAFSQSLDPKQPSNVPEQPASFGGEIRVHGNGWFEKQTARDCHPSAA